MKTVEMLWVMTADPEFHYQCLCQAVLQLPARDPGKWVPIKARGVDMFIDVGTWMDCPLCKTRYRVSSIDYDTSEKKSGRMFMEIAVTSQAKNKTGARLLLLNDDEEAE